MLQEKDVLIVTKKERKRVDMGEIVVTNQACELASTVGSCIAACIYDEMKNIGGMAHIVLPFQRGNKNNHGKGKFANIAIPTLLTRMKARGSKRQNLIFKIAGGANMFPSIKKNVLNIGDENTRAVIKLIEKEGLSLKAKDVGGHKGRKIHFDVASGSISIERINGETIII